MGLDRDADLVAGFCRLELVLLFVATTLARFCGTVDFEMVGVRGGSSGLCSQGESLSSLSAGMMNP